MCGMEPVIGSFFGNQFCRSAFFHNAAVVNDEDTVGFLDGGEAVCDYEGGTSFQQGVNAILYEQFRPGVDAGGGFVQDQDIRV